LTRIPLNADPKRVQREAPTELAELAIALNGETYVRSLSVCKKKDHSAQYIKNRGSSVPKKQNHEQEEHMLDKNKQVQPECTNLWSGIHLMLSVLLYCCHL
jgi:hypothetical protein